MHIHSEEDVCQTKEIRCARSRKLKWTSGLQDL